jgi:SAM-dependent methyltransferase
MMTELNSFRYTGLSELQELEKSLHNYNNFIVSSFIKHLSVPGKNILDFGAGMGTLAIIWSNLEKSAKITCFELDQHLLRFIRQRGLMISSRLDLEPIFDYVYTSNVLEHIEHDNDTLAQIHNVLMPNGKIGIFVPANKFIYSHIDKKLEHFRRYSKKELISKVRSNGFTVENCYYVDSLGVFAWLILKIFKIKFDSSGSKLLPIYDRLIWPISKFLDNLGLKYVFGKNLLLLASKN